MINGEEACDNGFSPFAEGRRTFPPFQEEAATEYGVCLDGQRAKPPSWCAVMMISFMPISAEASIQFSASRSVGLKTLGLRQG